ncbi:MAG TPA: thiamine diphosphokinase [Candidatus Tidjanibacter gallistercoris]|nr:thiamine diphosphokinase [Candidatus Tidjanibacter gallistercoris]
MPDASAEVETVILADGEYPSDGVPAALLAGARYVVCCDGAADAYTARGGRPSAIVGDGDSVSDGTARRFRDILFLNPDQETNDLTKAFSFCLSRGRTRITILGATGGREDHAIGNISLLAEYARQAEVQLVTPYGVFNAAEGTATFDSMPRQQVSLFTIRPGTRVAVRGLRYIPAAEGFRSWWCGTLNEAEGDTFGIETDGPVLVFRTFERKS